MSELIDTDITDINNLGEVFFVENGMPVRKGVMPYAPTCNYEARDDCPGDDFPTVGANRRSPLQWIKKIINTIKRGPGC